MSSTYCMVPPVGRCAYPYDGWAAGNVTGSAVEQYDVQLLQVLRVGDQADFDDATVDDVDHDRPADASVRCPRKAGHAGHECGPRRPRAPAQELGDSMRAAQLRGRPHADGVGVGSQHDLGIEHGQQTVEVTCACGAEEHLDDLTSTDEVDLACRRRALHAPA